ncbi:MAG: FAD-dependent oxidoreductase [Longimicrobiaceae bacterium]
MPYDRILELMTVPDRPDVYLLGTYAKRLTLYSQQTRAINLVDAIHWYRQPWRDVSLAVVGGGVAGITAAARAAQLGARVTLFERLQGVLEIQRKSERWLHPTLYEWPFSGLDEHEGRTQLPVMNWHAATAEKVADELTEEWNGSYQRMVTPYFNTEVLEIEDAAGGPRLRWRSKRKDGTHDEDGQFEKVIFAVGYGLEPRGPNRKSYWEKDSLDQTLRTDERVLIAGYGDGALTDLMRACLRKFDHRALLTDVVSAVTGELLDRIKSIETDLRSADAAYLTEEYEKLSVPAVQDFLKPDLNATRRVVLSGQGPYLFDPRASALNRLVASQLLRLEAFEHHPIGEREQIGAADDSDPVFVRLQEQAGQRFSDVVLRFGVERAITRISGLPTRSMERLRKAWDRIHPKLDPTRVRLWARVTPISADIDHSAVLFLSPSSDEEFLREVVQRAVEDVRSSQIRELRTIHLADCFQSDEALFHTVRALCRSPVAIFALGTNMGRENIGGMLLMGIRAAVRRGATVVVHEGPLTAAQWSDLPFNLKELQVYGLRGDEWLKSAALVGAAIREGLAVLSSDAPGYRDMPVFDIVRRPTRRTERPAADEREVFVLCSFDKSYEQSWQKLQTWLDGKDDGAGGKLSLRRVIDYVSPLLAGERLYELIRHAGTCLIDWTGWSPNVFFEMGVRLAVSSVPPVCLLRHGEAGPEKTGEQLLSLFDPLRYQRPGEDGGAFRAGFLERIAHSQPDSETVYSVVERNLALHDEYGGRPLYEQLFTAAQAMLGPDLANLNLLYGRNDRLRRQVLQSASDSLAAAELLIDRKLESGPDAPGDAELREFKEQIESLLAELRGLLQLDD